MAKRKQSKSQIDDVSDIMNVDVDAVLKDLHKAFGKGIAFRTQDTDKDYVKPVVSTGILSLDQALGIGGVPEGTIIELFGKQMSDKCNSKDSILSTSLGLLTIEELYKELGYQTTCVEREENIEDKNLIVHTNNGSHKVDRLFWNGKKPVYQVTTKSGLNLKITSNHQLKVMSENGFLEWRQCSELKSGDHVAVNRKEWDGGKDTLSPEEAKFIGYLIADGCLSGKNSTHFSNSNQDVIDDYINCVRSIDPQLEIKHYNKKASNGIDHHINSKKFRTYLFEKFGLDYVTAAEKTVPICVRKCTTNIWSEFLKTYFECEADIYTKKSIIEVSSASSLLLEQIQLMLLGFGIISKRFAKFNKEYQKDYYYLTVSGYNFDLFTSKIGFVSKERYEKVEKCKIHNHRTKEDTIPHQQALVRTLMRNMETNREWNYIANAVLVKGTDLTFNKLTNIFEYCAKNNTQHPIIDHWRTLENLKFDKIVNIKSAGEEPVFDIHQPTNHVFTANGIINHNSSLAMKIAGSAQKLGYTVFYIDAEYALDLKLAENTGVDVNSSNFVVIQPDYGEEAFATIETVLDSKLKAIVVVDSVAALLPKDEFESSLTDADRLGRIAALMSRSLRKLAGKISKAGCSVLFVNQTRDQIGGFGFAGMKTTGGHALKFYSSIRLKITRAQNSTIKHDSEIIGHRALITVEKNKLARPFKQVEVDLFYGSGFSGLSDLAKIAVHEGIIGKSGAWFSYNGEQIAQGFIGALEWFIQNKDAYIEMRDAVLKTLNIAELKHPDMYIDKSLAIKDNITGISTPLVIEADEDGDDAAAEVKSISEILKDDLDG